MISQRISDNHLLLTFAGKFNFENRKPFQEAIAEALASDHHQVVINLTLATYIDSAALGLLVTAHQRLQKINRKLILVATEGYVLKVLGLGQLHKLMTIVKSEFEALNVSAAVCR